MPQVVYVGDGNNITHSWIRLAARLKLDLVCACPEGFEPDMATVDLANSSGAGKVSISHDVMEVSPAPLLMLGSLRCMALVPQSRPVARCM